MKDKPLLYIFLAVTAVIGSFMAGAWYQRRNGSAGAGTANRRILYYVDPMHPAYKSDKPGTAPDCGMQLEPVYADGEGETDPDESRSPHPAGTINVTPSQLQAIGVQVRTLEKSPISKTLRTSGRITYDETLIIPVTSYVEGWIRKSYPVTTGSIIHKNEPLATFYNREFLTAQQTYFYALNTLDRFKEKESPEQMGLTNAQVRAAEENLQALGMGENQIREIALTRKAAREIEIRAPIGGFVVARNVFVGSRFDRGAELYRIADLSRVWVVADLFENEARLVRPGQSVVFRYQGRPFTSRVSSVPPQFDATSRTLKLRLEAPNPDFILKPEMFVDVEIPIKLPPSLCLPVDAVLDSGLKKTVFVERGNGVFEPRRVETGWRFGDSVEITQGLMLGERVVVSGTFLIDSESRMKAAAAGITGSAAKDPVCGMDVDEVKARAAGRTSAHSGESYFFCSDLCKQSFDKNPGRYIPPRESANQAGKNRSRD